MPKVLILDESVEFQDLLSQALESFDIAVAAKLNGSRDVLSSIERYAPQVLILDFFLKPYDALHIIDHLMRERPIPIILFLPPNYPDNSEIHQEAYRLGALVVYSKPITHLSLGWILPDIAESIYRLSKISAEEVLSQRLTAKSSGNLAKIDLPAQKALGIVGSTGAVEILKNILVKTPPNSTFATLVAQHMSSPVWDGFKDFLSRSTPAPVAMAKGGEIIREGHILLSPTQRTLMFQRCYSGKIATIENAKKFKPGQVPLQPNLDEFLISLSENFKRNAVGVILSGMGLDGSDGAKAILANGGKVLIQDPKTAIIPSMPLNALKNNPQAQTCRPEKMLEEISRLLA